MATRYAVKDETDCPFCGGRGVILADGVPVHFWEYCELCGGGGLLPIIEPIEDTDT